MKPLSQQLLAVLPAFLSVGLVLLSAAPMPGGTLTYTPNIAWLMTLVMAAHSPQCWPRGFAFVLGLLQDVLFGTPLGSQALLSLLAASYVTRRRLARPTMLFRERWLEAVAVLLVLHLLLWALLRLVSHDGTNLEHMLRMGIINALWYPLFYGLGTRLFAALSDAR